MRWVGGQQELSAAPVVSRAGGAKCMANVDVMVGMCAQSSSVQQGGAVELPLLAMMGRQHKPNKFWALGVCHTHFFG